MGLKKAFKKVKKAVTKVFHPSKNKSSQQDGSSEQTEELNEYGIKNLSQTGYTKFADLVEAKKRKEQELSGRKSRASGIGSLIGENNLLG